MENQQKLQILDIASICVCWFTMWSGFFFYTPRPPEQKSALEFLTVLVFLVNAVHMLILIGCMFLEMCKEKKESQLIQSLRSRTSSMVPNVVRNMRQRAREKRARRRLSLDFENPSLGVVAPSAGDVQMVNLGGGGGEVGEAVTTAAGETAVDIGEEEEVVEAAETALPSSMGEVKTTASARSGKTKKKQKKRGKGSKNLPAPTREGEGGEGGEAATTAAGETAVDIGEEEVVEAAETALSSSSSSSSAMVGEVKTADSARSSKTKKKQKSGAVEESSAKIRRQRLSSINARKKKIMQHKNPMKNKHTL
jgi:hypothetical protein